MEQKWKLYEKMFALTYSGIKNYELRLNDYKRRRVNIGDIVTFVCTTNPELTCQKVILKKEHYKTFNQFFVAHQLPNNEFTQEWRRVLNCVYKRKLIFKLGVVAFKLGDIKNDNIPNN